MGEDTENIQRKKKIVAIKMVSLQFGIVFR